MNTQHLSVVPTVFVLEHRPQDVSPEDDDWIVLIRAPEGGLTVVRAARPGDADERWVGFSSASTAHDLDVPGMLSAIVEPLARADIPVFVTSTFHADLVLVPEPRKEQAVAVLRSAGHQVSA